MRAAIKNATLAAIERGFASVPRARPPAADLARARIVSHRGECDNRRIRENTFAAFDPLLDTGVWGIEFDLRWTRDLEPVVCHDADLRRVFGSPLSLSETPFATLRARCPELPHLGDFVQRYGRRFHLMLELKAEHYPDPERQQTHLLQHLSGLRPADDFHVLAMETGLFRHVDALPPACRLPVARWNIKAISAYALENRCAGIAGPYFALPRRLIELHRGMDQSTGVGFPATRNVLFREIGRGVAWLFCNRALRMQRLLDEAVGSQR